MRDSRRPRPEPVEGGAECAAKEKKRFTRRRGDAERLCFPRSGFSFLTSHQGAAFGILRGLSAPGFLSASPRLRANQESLRSLRFYRSEEHTSELQSLIRTSYAVFCLKKQN